MTEINPLEELKQEYKKFEKKYSLPSFTELNEEFSIEKITDTETELLLKEIRRYVADKLMHYSNFIEACINPANQSMFMFSFVRSMCPEDKEKANEIYKELSKIRLELIKIDTTYSEEKEASFIKNSFTKWNEVKKELINIIGNVEKKFGETTNNCNNKDYFG